MTVSQGTSTEKEEGSYSFQDENDAPCTFKLIISGENNLNIERIEAALNNCRALKIEKVSLVDTTNNTLHTVEKSALIRSWSCNRLPAKYGYDQLCKSWNFKIDNDPGIRIWSTLEATELDQIKQCQVEWQLRSLSFGNFIDKQTCEEVAVLNSQPQTLAIPPLQFLLRFVDKKSFELEIRGKNYSRAVLFESSCLLDFALIDWKEEHVAKLFLPYSRVPSLVIKNDQKEYLNLSYRTGLNGLDKKILEYFSENSVITFHINLDISKKPRDSKSSPRMLRNLFHCSGLFPFSVFDTSVHIVHASSQSLEEIWGIAIAEALRNPDFQLLLWELSVIRTQKNCNAPNVYIKQFLEMSLQVGNVSVLVSKLKYHFFRKPLSSYWMDYAALISCIKEEMSGNFIEENPSSLLTKVRQVTITPTRNIFDPVMNDHKSRLFRNYGKFKFTVIRFRDENLQNLKGTDSFKFVYNILQKGVLLNGEKYFFLCTSNSGLKNHNAIFVACDNVDVAAQIRAEIVLNPEEFHSVSRYLTSLSLFCTNDQPTIQVLPEHLESVPDIKSVSGDLLTDGAGFIRLSLAMKISQHLDLNFLPSAFQVRLAGIKGVLLVIEDKHMNEMASENKHILIRPSMVKFMNNDVTLGVVDYSRFLPVQLNREVITLIESINPSVSYSLREMLEEALSTEVKSLVQLDMAVEKLSSLPNDWKIGKISKTFNILEEDFWSQIVRKLFVIGLKNLRMKTKIPVEKAAFLFGVADPFQILDDNEVFIQVKKDACSEPFIISGEVLIYRNPCLHPGDIRVVKAVNKPEFQIYKNVLIFPAKPSCKYSLSAACSGGDLDGDQFSVIWDSRLVPPKSVVVSPFNYAKLKSKMPSCILPSNLNSICNFFIKCLSSDMLGQISNLHLALCDQLDKGACDPIAMKLAEAQAYAVDFPKTGILPEVPTDAWHITSANGYPEFMEKNEKISYISKKIIGQLYHSTVAFDLDIATCSRSGPDLDLIIPGHEDFLKSAEKDYELYSLSLKNIMYQCGFQDEYNIVIGRDPFAIAAQSFTRHKSSLAQKAMDNLKSTFKTKFYEGITTHCAIKAKASAWYKVSYTRAKHDSETFLSFAWLVSDVLCEIKRAKLLPEKSFNYEKLIFKEIGTSARSYFFENLNALKQVTSQKIDAGKMIAALIKDKNLVFLSDVQIHGSVATYICDSESDINISLLLSRPEASEIDILVDYIKPILIGKTENCSVVASSSGAHIRCDISHNGVLNIIKISIDSMGVHKSEIIQSLTSSKLEFLPVFWFLVRWAKITGLVRDNRIPSEDCVLSATDFCGLIMNVLQSSEPLTLAAQVKENCASFTFETLNESFDEAIGKHILSFFQEALCLTKLTAITWNNPKIEDVQLNPIMKSKILKLSRMAEYTMLISKSCSLAIKSVKSDSTNSLSCSIKLPHILSTEIIGRQEYHSSRLSEVTKARVDLKTVEGDTRVILSAVGSHAEIFRVYEEIQILSHCIRMQRVVPRCQLFHYFMANSDVYFIRNADVLSADIKFVRSKGPFQYSHSIYERYSLKLCSTQYIKEWKIEAIETFTAHICRQFAKFPIHDKQLLDSLKLTARFGNFYVFNISLQKDKKISFQHFLTMFAKQMHRQQYFRHRNHKLFENDSSDLKVVKLRPKNQHPLSQSKQQSAFSKPAIKRPSRNFCVGLTMENNSDPNTTKTAEDVYVKALKMNDFVEGKIHPDAFTFSVSASLAHSFDEKILLDDELNVLSISEKDLHWASGYILHGKELSNNPVLMNEVDCRIVVSSTDKTEKKNPCFKFLFGDDKVRSPIKLENNRVMVSDNVDPGARSRIRFVMHKQRIVRFTSGKIGATISSGVSYEGEGLSYIIPFSKMTLHFDNVAFKKALQQNDLPGIRDAAVQIFIMADCIATSISDVAKNVAC